MSFRVKSLFFESGPVIAAMDVKTRKALSRFGAFVRRTAKSSLRYGKGVSEPGDPPKVHRTQVSSRKRKKDGTPQSVSPLRELLFFSYDPANRSVVIGPELFRGAKSQGVPEALEDGGSVLVRQRGDTVTLIHIRPRPFMQPAFEKELPNAPSQWAE